MTVRTAMRGVKEGKVMLVGTNPSWREYYKGIPFWKSRVGSYIARQLQGAIVEEECDSGDQDFICNDEKFFIYKDYNKVKYSRDVVMKSPE